MGILNSRIGTLYVIDTYKSLSFLILLNKKEAFAK